MSARWCSTTNLPGGRENHDHPDEADDRAADLAVHHLTGADTTIERLTLWVSDGGPAGWQSIKVIDIAKLANRLRAPSKRVPS